MSVLEKLYNLVKTLNMNDDNEEKCYVVSTDFIRKLTDLFLIFIGEKSLTKIPLSNMYRLGKSETLTRLYRTVYIELDYYSPYKNDEEKVTEDIEVLKLGKLSSQKNIDNIEREYDERNQMDISDYRDSGER